MGPKPLPREVLFWGKVQKTDKCWLWTGEHSTVGYGFFSVWRNNKRTARLGAHRVSWELHNGPIPDGLCVMHKCDVPLCVRPDHLTLGTQAENLLDARTKGRMKGPPPQVGTKNCKAKLSEANVLEIRHRVYGGEKQRTLANEFGVSQYAISAIKLRKVWRHI